MQTHRAAQLKVLRYLDNYTACQPALSHFLLIYMFRRKGKEFQLISSQILCSKCTGLLVPRSRIWKKIKPGGFFGGVEGGSFVGVWDFFLRGGFCFFEGRELQCGIFFWFVCFFVGGGCLFFLLLFVWGFVFVFSISENPQWKKKW